MDEDYAQTQYVQALEYFIKKHEFELLNLTAELEAAKPFKAKIKEECDKLVEDMKKIDSDENSEFDETLMQQRKQIADELIEKWEKFMFFRDKIEECETKKEKSAGVLHELYLQRLHMSVCHNK